ncbi:MBL fold metallo-hydrolase [Lentzea tibetensis]|uniref:MBL fold metallo-hydrolase n=1 Tax=Lentzea tibetensis TaxID=2591470 RepID=A0A563EX14_9PSEU|nr:MBL fold metallo-hydrolase [Lentzea tibetensis]TWP52235.1 MBL fold metallo-hydrolase [Lentzea tibetensis]
MRVTVLGCSGGWPAAGRPCSGYLLEAGGRQVWLDAGTGTMPELLRHTTLADLDAVWISHLHPDHCSDLFGAFQALKYGNARDDRLPVYGPPRWASAFEAFAGPATGVFEVHELVDGGRVDLGPLQLEAVFVPHVLPTFGVRASADGKVFGYTADYEPGADLSRFADVDLLLAEAWRSADAVAALGVRAVITHVHPDLDPLEVAGDMEAAAPGMVISM